MQYSLGVLQDSRGKAAVENYQPYSFQNPSPFLPPNLNSTVSPAAESPTKLKATQTDGDTPTQGTCTLCMLQVPGSLWDHQAKPPILNSGEKKESYPSCFVKFHPTGKRSLNRHVLTFFTLCITNAHCPAKIISTSFVTKPRVQLSCPQGKGPWHKPHVSAESRGTTSHLKWGVGFWELFRRFSVLCSQILSCEVLLFRGAMLTDRPKFSLV